MVKAGIVKLIQQQDLGNHVDEIKLALWVWCSLEASKTLLSFQQPGLRIPVFLFDVGGFNQREEYGLFVPAPGTAGCNYHVVAGDQKWS